MLDLGLLVTMVVLWAGLAAAARWLPITSYERADVLDQLYGPALAGLVVGRLTAVLLDDPESLGSIRALLVVRSGVEPWARPEEHTSALPSLMRISDAAFCLEKKKSSI